MKLYVLFAQRKESYEGEYSPEALACMEDVGNDINPDYLLEQTQDAMNDDMMVGARVFEIQLPEGTSEFIRNQLIGNLPPIKAVSVAVNVPAMEE